MAEWRNIKALKRAGRGHDPTGVDATQEGELIVLCPACPHPGKNLAETLTDVVPRNQYVFIIPLFQMCSNHTLQMALLLISSY